MILLHLVRKDGPLWGTLLQKPYFRVHGQWPHCLKKKRKEDIKTEHLRTSLSSVGYYLGSRRFESLVRTSLLLKNMF